MTMEPFVGIRSSTLIEALALAMAMAVVLALALTLALKIAAATHLLYLQ